MRFCLPLFLALLAWLPLAADKQPDPAPFLGLKWGINQFQVEDVLASDDALLPHGGYIILHVGTEQIYARRYGTYIITSVPMDLVCGFRDDNYTELQMILLRYSGRSFNHVLGIYDTLADLFTAKLLAGESDRSLRSRERRPTRQDRVIDWTFGETQFQMKVWGSDASGRISVMFRQVQGS